MPTSFRYHLICRPASATTWLASASWDVQLLAAGVCHNTERVVRHDGNVPGWLVARRREREGENRWMGTAGGRGRRPQVGRRKGIALTTGVCTMDGVTLINVVKLTLERVVVIGVAIMDTKRRDVSVGGDAEKELVAGHRWKEEESGGTPL